VKLLVDMNLSPRWVERLNAAGFVAIHWSQVGRMDALDSEIMAYAASHDYVVVTHDLDFSAILAATQGIKPSVVQVRSDNLGPASIGEQLIGALRQMEPDLAAGALVTIDPARTRINLLPLRTNQSPP
jgi:predicted nuclease of predicted toxin-antitoxin system